MKLTCKLFGHLLTPYSAVELQLNKRGQGFVGSVCPRCRAVVPGERTVSLKEVRNEQAQLIISLRSEIQGLAERNAEFNITLNKARELARETRASFDTIQLDV